MNINHNGQSNSGKGPTRDKSHMVCSISKNKKLLVADQKVDQLIVGKTSVTEEI